MFGRKKKDDEQNKPQPEKSETGDINDQLRAEMNSSFDDMRSELDDHLGGRSDTRRGGSKLRESADFPWSSELDVDAEVAGAPASPKRSGSYHEEEKEGDIPIFSHGRRDAMLPSNWEKMSPTEQHNFLEHLHDQGQVSLKDLLHLFPKASDVHPEEEKKGGLFSRASRTKKREEFLTDAEYVEHQRRYKAHSQDNMEFDPMTAKEFNTDARKLREYETVIKVAKGANIEPVRDALAKKEKLLKTYEDLGKRQDPKRNYPHADQSSYNKEILVLKEAYRKGYRKEK